MTIGTHALLELLCEHLIHTNLNHRIEFTLIETRKLRLDILQPHFIIFSKILNRTAQVKQLRHLLMRHPSLLLEIHDDLTYVRHRYRSIISRDIVVLQERNSIYFLPSPRSKVPIKRLLIQE